MCEVCGAEPLQRVLHPVAVHYKGSGFYSTDYGRGGRKPKDSGSGDSSPPRRTAARPPPTARRRRERGEDEEDQTPAAAAPSSARRPTSGARERVALDAAGPVGRRRRLRRRVALPHRERVAVVLARDDHRLAAGVRRVAAETAVERVAARRAELHPAELEELRASRGRSRAASAATPPLNGSLQRASPATSSFEVDRLHHGLLARARVKSFSAGSSRFSRMRE